MNQTVIPYDGFPNKLEEVTIEYVVKHQVWQSILDKDRDKTKALAYFNVGDTEVAFERIDVVKKAILELQGFGKEYQGMYHKVEYPQI